MRIGIQKKQLPRFFSMTATKAVSSVHKEYGQEVQAYFHRLFPRRKWQVLSDPLANPLAVDVEMLYPTVEEPFYLLHTVGMSAVPMYYPAGKLAKGQEAYSELCMILPADWPFLTGSRVTLTDPAAWPLWLLMELGRFPHVHQIWMSYGFTLPNTEACEPFSPLSAFAGVIIVQFEGELGEVTMADGTAVELLMPIPVYKEELEVCGHVGVDAVIEEILDCNGGSFLVDMHRPNVGGGAYREEVLAYKERE